MRNFFSFAYIKFHLPFVSQLYHFIGIFLCILTLSCISLVCLKNLVSSSYCVKN